MAEGAGKSKAKELALLAKQCQTILTFAESKGLQGGLHEVLAEAIRRGDLRGIRSLASDLFEMVRGLPENEQYQINDELVKKSGSGLPELTRKRERRISKIRKRGKIVGEEECRLVLERVDEMYSDSQQRDEIMKLNEMLAAYKPFRD